MSSLADRLQLGDAAAVEEQAERAEHFLDLGVAAGALERDVVAVAERLVGGAGLGRGERHELLAEQAGLADRGDRVVREAGVVAELDRDHGVVAVEVDVGDLADGHVADLDRRLRDEVEHVLELDRDLDRVVADVGATRQRELVDVELAAGQQQRADQERRRGAQAAGLHRATSTSPLSVGSYVGSPVREPVPSPNGARARQRQVLDQVADGAVGVVGRHQGAQERAGVARQVVDQVPDVGVGVEGAGLRVVAEAEVVERERPGLQDHVEVLPVLDQELRDPVDATDVAARARPGSP